jgi:hypothetical protein
MRIKSTLPIGINISEPHPDPEHPGNSPALKSFVLRPGVNDLSDTDAATYKAWADASGQGFIASADDVKAGTTDGKVYDMTEDEPETEYGFEPALKRAVDAGKSDAGKGSTVTEPGPVKSDDMRTGSPAVAAAPVLTASAPLKVPVTAEAPAASPAAKVAPPAPAATPAK